MGKLVAVKLKALRKAGLQSRVVSRELCVGTEPDGECRDIMETCSYLQVLLNEVWVESYSEFELLFDCRDSDSRNYRHLLALKEAGCVVSWV